MKRTEKANRIMQQLEALYPNPPIPLDHLNPYTFLVAVMLSAQTTDKKVNEVTPALFDKASSPEDMARLTVEEILPLIRQLGLAPTKAKNLKALSEQLVRDHQGNIPNSLDALEALPGVGHKTASVVLSQIFGIATFPVDTHIHRLAARWGLSNGSSVTQTERDLKQCFPEEAWRDLHLQIIYFGREYCPARSHDLQNCPICSWAASKKRIKEESRQQSLKSRNRSKR